MTNPSVNLEESPFFITRRLIQPPRESSRCSIRRATPRQVPTTMQMIRHRVCSVWMAEVMPMPSTHRAIALCMADMNRGPILPFSSRPRRLPANTRAQLI